MSSDGSRHKVRMEVERNAPTIRSTVDIQLPSRDHPKDCYVHQSSQVVHNQSQTKPQAYTRTTRLPHMR